MEIAKKLIIFSLLSLNSVSMSNGKYCTPMTCSDSGTSIKYPFYIKGRKPNSCDTTGFDVYCDDKSGKPLLDLPFAGNFSIEQIYLSQIDLSDPDGCLPRRLTTLDLNNITPFQLLGQPKNYSLYNCSQRSFNYTISYEHIACLSDFANNVISTMSDTAFFDSNPNCEFLKTLSAPAGYSFYSSRISLTWNEKSTRCPLCGEYHSSSDSEDGRRLRYGVTLAITTAILICVCVCCKCCKQGLNQPNTNRSSGVQRQSREDVIVQGGLDQETIDSYPVVVIGQSGRLIKPEDNTCPICLSDYAAHETLKMLPECLHRFHADCIDQWLRAKAICPICRTSPPRS